MATQTELKLLSTIGVTIKADSTAIEGAVDFGDLGGEAQTLDATVLTDTVQRNIPGVQQLDSWVVTYNYNIKDSKALDALVDAKKAVPIEVTLPDKTTYKNAGIPGSNIMVGAGTNAVLQGKVSFQLQEAWTKTYTAAS